MTRIRKAFSWILSKFATFNGACVLVALLLVYGAYVSLTGYPSSWQKVYPNTDRDVVHALCGPPDEFNDKWGSEVWRSYHLLGWFEMEVEAKAVYITSHIGVGKLVHEKLLVARYCSSP